MADGAPIYSSIDVEDSLTFFKQQPKKSVASEGDSVGKNAGTIKETESGEVDENGQLKKTEDKEEIEEWKTSKWQFLPDETSKKFHDWRASGKGKGTWDETDIFFEDQVTTGPSKIAKKAHGGRIGYMDGTDPEVTELDMLNKWWRDQLATAWKE